MKAKKMLLPTDAKERKSLPITEGVLDYFPLAIAEVAKCSHAGNQQHNPGSKLHWDKTKSTDHANCIGRHLIDRGSFDTDGVRHSAKLAWRALALLQTELEDQNAHVTEGVDGTDGWIFHTSGKPPNIPPDTPIHLMLSDKEILDNERTVDSTCWKNSPFKDIIAYRIVK